MIYIYIYMSSAILHTILFLEESHRNHNQQKMPSLKEITDNIITKLKTNNNRRVYVVLVGSPGSGKTTVADILRASIVDYFQNHADILAPLAVVEDTSSKDLNNITTDVPLVANNELLNEHRIENPDASGIENFKTFKYYTTEGDLVLESGGGPDNSIRLAFKQGAAHSVDLNNMVSVVPMDGFHLSREVLSKFKNHEEMHKRRGAYFTFDSKNYLELVKVIGSLDTERGMANVDLYFPGFSHTLKDPQRDQHVLYPETRVVILEGLYLLLDKPNWRDLLNYLPNENTLIYKIDLEEAVLEQRVSERHVQSGICKTLEEGVERYRFNDSLNGRFIEENMVSNNSVIHIRND